jgi:hypothetical protein
VAVFDNFCANEKERWFRQKGRAAEYLSGRKPEQIKFLAAWCDEEIPGRAFEEKKQVICPFFLIRHHRVTRESAVGGSPQDSIRSLPGRRSKPYPERIGSQRSHAHAKGVHRARGRTLSTAALWLKRIVPELTLAFFGVKRHPGRTRRSQDACGSETCSSVVDT